MWVNQTVQENKKKEKTAFKQITIIAKTSWLQHNIFSNMHTPAYIYYVCMNSVC